eukprot:7375882-Prymnesium_polylepis.1
MLTLAATLLATHGATPPLYRITAYTHYEAGHQHGQIAEARIKGWLQSPEMVGLVNYTSAGEGREALEAMKRDNTAVFPDLVKELEGIAHGAGVPVDSIWVSTLISELESLQVSTSSPPRPSWCPLLDAWRPPAHTERRVRRAEHIGSRRPLLRHIRHRPRRRRARLCPRSQRGLARPDQGLLVLCGLHGRDNAGRRADGLRRPRLPGLAPRMGAHLERATAARTSEPA